jgi:hypothetical protein
MTSRYILALLLTAAAAAVSACSDDGGTEPPPGVDPFFPADYLNSYVLVRDCRFSVEHDGVYVTVHADPASADDYVDGNYPFEEGTILVKTLFHDENCSDLAGYAVMKKGPAGTAPSSGDWLWQDVGATRSVAASGVLQACISCHSVCTEGRDFACTDK